MTGPNRAGLVQSPGLKDSSEPVSDGPGVVHSATVRSFQIKAVALPTRLYRFVAEVRRRTEAKGLSTTFVVLRCFQWLSGKPKNVTIRSQSSSSVSTAFGYQAL